MRERLFWIDTTYACGGILTSDAGRIVGACPIYRKFRGQHLNEVIRTLRRKRVFRAWHRCEGEA